MSAIRSIDLLVSLDATREGDSRVIKEIVSAGISTVLKFPVLDGAVGTCWAL